MKDIRNSADLADIKQPTSLPAEDEFFGGMKDPTTASIKGLCGDEMDSMWSSGTTGWRMFATAPKAAARSGQVGDEIILCLTARLLTKVPASSQYAVFMRTVTTE